jgi:hypothetical protein
MKQNLHLGEMLKQSLADKLTQLEKEVFDIGALVPIMEGATKTVQASSLKLLAVQLNTMSTPVGIMSPNQTNRS